MGLRPVAGIANIASAIIPGTQQTLSIKTLLPKGKTSCE